MHVSSNARGWEERSREGLCGSHTAALTKVLAPQALLVEELRVVRAGGGIRRVNGLHEIPGGQSSALCGEQQRQSAQHGCPFPSAPSVAKLGSCWRRGETHKVANPYEEVGVGQAGLRHCFGCRLHHRSFKPRQHTSSMYLETKTLRLSMYNEHLTAAFHTAALIHPGPLLRRHRSSPLTPPRA